MRLFISYCHKDERYIEKFIKVLAPITGDDKLISDVWYDRNIKTGEEFWDKIDEHLANRDVICLFLSIDYLASASCKKEIHKALERRNRENILVIPVVLKPCGWIDESDELSSILAVPKDAKPISSFENEDEAWMDVYRQIKLAIEQYVKIREISINTDFSDFLNDATTFTKANPNKNILKLDDIFVYPDLDKIEKDGECSRISSKYLIDHFDKENRFVIVGEDQSGKTSLLKKYIKELVYRNYYPIYVKDPAEILQGDFEYRIYSLFKKQYISEVELSELNRDKIIAIVDDFHKAKNKAKVLEQLLRFKNFIVVVDDIYTLDTQNNVFSDFQRYEIKQLKPSQRNELVRKWLTASDTYNNKEIASNDELQKIDEAYNLIEATLGRILGKGIMPAYAYFILTMLVVNEGYDKPLDEKITSQGHCYQALIVLFLKKQGVSNAQMDSYINFLTELAVKIYYNHGLALTSLQFDDFVEEYKTNYNFTDSLRMMLEKLDASNIMTKNTLGNYEFNYPYIYYFFAGRFFAQVWEDIDDPNHDNVKKEIETILLNLHKTSNAYIAVFIAHHTKNTALLQRIKDVAKDIYAKYQPASFDSKSLSVFSSVENKFSTPSLPAQNAATQNRQMELERKDKVELQSDSEQNEMDEELDEEDEITKELRRSIKTVEVIGSIIKNRAGSLRNDQLESLFEDAMDVQLRLVTNFLNIVKNIVESDEGLNFLEKKIKETHPEYDDTQLGYRANMLFWSMNLCFLFSVVKKLAFSIGSSTIAKVAKNVCDRRNTPASFMLKHTIFMWFKKNIDITELQKMDKSIDNKTAKDTMLWLISDYCRMHVIGYKETSKLIQLGLKKQLFLPSPNKETK